MPHSKWIKERKTDRNFHKFKGNGDLRDFLLDTGDKILVEASPYDTIWGIGMKEDNLDCLIPRNWKGELSLMKTSGKANRN